MVLKVGISGIVEGSWGVWVEVRGSAFVGLRRLAFTGSAQAKRRPGLLIPGRHRTKLARSVQGVGTSIVQAHGDRHADGLGISGKQTLNHRRAGWLLRNKLTYNKWKRLIRGASLPPSLTGACDGNPNILINIRARNRELAAGFRLF